MIPNMFEKEKQAVTEDLKEKNVAIIVDETTDAQNRSIMNTLLKPLTPHAKPVVVSVDFMSNVNSREVAQKIERTLLEYKVEFHQVRALVSDNAPYMKACFNVLSPLYENMIHVTCWAHIISLVGACWKDAFPQVDRLVACVKSLFVNSPCRRRRWLALLEKKGSKVLSFPIPVVTRWNSWFQSVSFIREYVDELKEFTSQELSEGTRPLKLRETIDLMSVETLKEELCFLAAHSPRLQRDLVGMETASPAQVRKT